MGRIFVSECDAEEYGHSVLKVKTRRDTACVKVFRERRDGSMAYLFHYMPVDEAGELARALEDWVEEVRDGRPSESPDA